MDNSWVSVWFMVFNIRPVSVQFMVIPSFDEAVFEQGNSALKAKK